MDKGNVLMGQENGFEKNGSRVERVLGFVS
jgi:hypothetical protein